MARTTGGKRGRPPAAGAAYRRLAAELLRAIDTGRFPPGSLLPSTRALQQECGVGYRTVWLAVSALKKEGRLAPTAGRRLAVLSAEARGASVLSPILLVIGHGNLTSVLRNVASRALYTGIGMGAGDLDAPLLIAHQPPLQRRLPDGFASASLRGIVLFGHFRPAVLRAYEQVGVPAVLVDWPVAGWKGHSLHVDNPAAARDAVERLATLGHRRIAFVSYVSMVQRDVDLDAKERARGFLLALKELGLPSRRESVFKLPPREPDTPRALKRLLSARPAFTAVLAADEDRAAKTIEAARAAGKRVPADLSVAAFQPLAGDLNPDLTGPVIDFEQMGREAVALLSAPARPVRKPRFATSWKEGGTVAAPQRVPRSSPLSPEVKR